MTCPNCGTSHAQTDNFCRRCGWNLSGAAVPMVIEQKERSITPYQAEQALAIGGAATVVAGALVWLARRWLASQAVQPAGRRVAPRARPAARDDDWLFESWVMVRRITFRR